MPIPKPKNIETKNKFIARCMNNKVMVNEFTNPKQRLAVCEKQWEDNK